MWMGMVFVPATNSPSGGPPATTPLPLLNAVKVRPSRYMVVRRRGLRIRWSPERPILGPSNTTPVRQSMQYELPFDHSSDRRRSLARPAIMERRMKIIGIRRMMVALFPAAIMAEPRSQSQLEFSAGRAIERGGRE
jgi:hypothetical protein